MVENRRISRRTVLVIFALSTILIVFMEILTLSYHSNNTFYSEGGAYGTDISTETILRSNLSSLERGSKEDVYFSNLTEAQNSLTTVADKAIKLNSPVQTNVIINAYMRSGSSFTGRLFQGIPHTFYTYEPLWNALRYQYYNTSKFICHYSRQECYNTTSITKTTYMPLNHSLEFLRSLMECTFHLNRFRMFYVDNYYFRNEFPNNKQGWHFYKAWEEYINCSGAANSNFSTCLETMVPVCLQSDVRVSKVLRTTLNSLDFLMRTVPNLKVIQLFRDPRAIINSRINSHFYSSRIKTHFQKKQDILSLCNRMDGDLVTSRKFLKLYPDRFKVVQYEDLLKLEEKSKILYNFFGMPVTTKVMEKMSVLSNKSSRVDPFKYIFTLRPSLLDYASEQCKQLIYELGYPNFNTTHTFLNTTVRFDKNNLPFSL